MPKVDAGQIKKAYLDAGGSESGWEIGKAEMIEAARRQQAITEALAEANKPVNLNDALRLMARAEEESA